MKKNVSKAERNLYEALRKYPVLIHKNFCLFHAGERGDDYFDIDRIACNPLIQRDLINRFKEKIDVLERGGMQYDKIAFIDKEMGPTGAIILASALSQKLKKEIIILRLRKKLRFDHVMVKGWIKNEGEYPLKPNDLVLLIDDVITTGSTQKRAIELVEKFGAKVTGIVCAFVRENEAIENIREEKKVDFIDTIWTYDELAHIGYILPHPRRLWSENLAHELADEVLPECDATKPNRDRCPIFRLPHLILFLRLHSLFLFTSINFLMIFLTCSLLASSGNNHTILSLFRPSL